jgi:hypothetical protein
MAKKVSFGAKPPTKPVVDNWVDKREVPTVESAAPEPKVVPQESSEPKMKRLTLDIPESLHRQIKGKAVLEGVTMVEMLRELLETTYL